jgi:hypothetical protein
MAGGNAGWNFSGAVWLRRLRGLRNASHTQNQR